MFQLTQNSCFHILLGVLVAMGIGRYLGLPLMIERSKNSVFGFIKDKVWTRINSLSTKSMSMTGREVLIKSVLQVIPTYCMSI